MRPRFSLRTLLIATAILAVFLYYWVIMPTQAAKRFILAINSQDYATAGKLVGDPQTFDPTILNRERWRLTTEAELMPWSGSQFLQGNRKVVMRMKYFQLDQNFDTAVQLTATPLGLGDMQTIRLLPSAVIDTSQRITISR